MNNRPIGVFDSGVGGLTVVKQLMELLPGEDIVYFGDTGRTPYGTRSDSAIKRLSGQDIAFLLSKDVKLVVAACGTASANLNKSYTDTLPVPFTGTVEQTAIKAAKSTRNKKVGVIGTPATIRSTAHETVIKNMDKTIDITSVECPLFVPLVEYNIAEKNPDIIRSSVKMYLSTLKSAQVDTLIMGCTHYPILEEYIREYMGDNVLLINPGIETAAHVKSMLEMRDITSTHRTGEDKYFVSDSPQNFISVAHLFLGQNISDRVTKINIEEY